MKRLTINQITPIVAILALVSYIWIAVFGLFPSPLMSKMGSVTHHCPFSLGEHSICDVSSLHHIQEWQAFSTTTLPVAEILLLVAAGFLAFRFLNIIVQDIFFATENYKKRIFIPLYQQLFSQGILNPKPY